MTRKIGAFVLICIVFIVSLEIFLRLAGQIFFHRSPVVVEEGDENKIRILAIGESTTDQAISVFPAWPKQLEKLLASQGHAVKDL